MPKEYKILINGVWRTTSRPLDVTSPFDKTVVGRTYLASNDELKEAVDGAEAAFRELRSWPSYRKAAVIQKVVDGIKERAEELSKTIALEAGKPIKDSRVEVKRAISTFQLALEETKRLGGEVMPLDIIEGSEGRFGIIRRFPVGPVLGISPFNFPLNLVAHKAAPAMACGSPIIIKPASNTPLTGLVLGEIITNAGWPAGGLNVVPASSEDAEKLIEDERIKTLTFTGSPAVGWRLKAKAGQKKVTLELGGNAGVIVHSDADIGLAAKRCTEGAFSFAGQICISVQRIYVEKTAFDEFRDAFLKHVSKIRLGNPLDEDTDVGPMIDEAALQKTEEFVNEAISGGAKLLAGGKRKGNFFEPTVLTGANPMMKVCSEEVFAPVVTLEPYDGFKDAVKELNCSKYGLQAGVFTSRMGNILLAYETLDVGGVIVNDIPTFRVDNMPYGGVKMSGFGREGVRYAIEEMTEPKLLVLKAD
ncbi:MAG: aldehyde dehydrogenase family protein [Deltaproteobacteria bacterium]|nr:aldehyde dehydrogenase family protein [Deltaproteobacteria bacterium]